MDVVWRGLPRAGAGARAAGRHLPIAGLDINRAFPFGNSARVPVIAPAPPGPHDAAVQSARRDHPPIGRGGERILQAPLQGFFHRGSQAGCEAPSICGVPGRRPGHGTCVTHVTPAFTFRFHLFPLPSDTAGQIGSPPMLNKLIDFAVHRRAFTLALTVGLRGLRRLHLQQAEDRGLPRRHQRPGDGHHALPGPGRRGGREAGHDPRRARARRRAAACWCSARSRRSGSRR